MSLTSGSLPVTQILMQHIRHLSLWSNICIMKLTRLLLTLWRMNLCLPSLKKWGHCVAGLLISSSCKLHEELGMKALLHFVQILGFVFSSTWFTWALCVSWSRFSINYWWQIGRMVNNRALRSSMPSLHLSCYICYELGGILSINSWHRLLYRRCYEHISECFRTCSADLFSYLRWCESCESGCACLFLYLHPEFD
jgi:hypothetical protein